MNITSLNDFMKKFEQLKLSDISIDDIKFDEDLQLIKDRCAFISEQISQSDLLSKKKKDFIEQSIKDTATILEILLKAEREL